MNFERILAVFFIKICNGAKDKTENKLNSRF